MAGVAMIGWPIGFLASRTKPGPALTRDVAVLARQVELAVGGDRRGAEAAAAARAAARKLVAVASRSSQKSLVPEHVSGRRRPAASACRSPRLLLLPHNFAAASSSPSGSVMSPRAPARMAKIGAFGSPSARDHDQSSAKTGVGAVIFELRPSRQSSLPVAGS